MMMLDLVIFSDAGMYEACLQSWRAALLRVVDEVVWSSRELQALSWLVESRLRIEAVPRFGVCSCFRVSGTGRTRVPVLHPSVPYRTSTPRPALYRTTGGSGGGTNIPCSRLYDCIMYGLNNGIEPYTLPASSVCT